MKPEFPFLVQSVCCFERKTRAQDKWDEKAGIAAKTYKVDKVIAEQFKETCKKINVGQGPTLTKLMQDFIDSNN